VTTIVPDLTILAADVPSSTFAVTCEEPDVIGWVVVEPKLLVGDGDPLSTRRPVQSISAIAEGPPTKLRQPKRVNSTEGVARDVRIGIQAAGQPDRITLDVSPGDRVVVAEVVVDLRDNALARQPLRQTG
jgi:hypothetical protein